MAKKSGKSSKSSKGEAELVDSNKIRAMVRAVENYKAVDPAASLLKTIADLAEQMMSIYKLISDEKYESEEEMLELNLRISVVAEEKRNAEKKYNTLMDEKFAEFKDQFSEIYQMAVREEGMDHTTLDHVLRVYDDYNKGKVTKSTGTNMGLDYMKERFSLPDNFFNYLPEEK
jgi:hypothetical protein